MILLSIIQIVPDTIPHDYDDNDDDDGGGSSDEGICKWMQLILPCAQRGKPQNTVRLIDFLLIVVLCRTFLPFNKSASTAGFRTGE